MRIGCTASQFRSSVVVSHRVPNPARQVITIPPAHDLGGRVSGRTDSKRFRVRRDSIPAARRHVRTVLVGWKLGGLVDDASLIASELATNVIAHAKGTGDYFELGFRRRDGVLILEVADSYQWLMPELRKPADDETSGRGLLIVDALAERWGVHPRNPGKTVWAQLPAGARLL
nr:ATP-binding protein [Streptomyces sp. SID8374]